MSDQSLRLQSINYRQMWPWTHLFRAFRIAVDVRNMLLAGAAIMLLVAGNRLIDRLPFSPSRTGAESKLSTSRWPWDYRPTIPTARSSAPTENWDQVGVTTGGVGRALVLPLASVYEPGETLFKNGNSWSTAAHAWTRLLWALAVWSLFGGAIARNAALQFAGEEHVRIRTALKYTGTKFLSYFAAPLLPLLGLGFFWFLCAAGGLFGRIPVAGEWLVGLLWILPLLCGIVMALIVVGLAVGWPLMMITVSVEGTDAFDGFSRAYSYVYNRPWQFLWQMALAAIYGLIVTSLLWWIAGLVVYVSTWAVTSGMGVEAAVGLRQSVPPIFDGGAMPGADVIGEPTETGTGSLLVGAWLRLAGIVVVGFAPSYFWTAWTIHYFLLRYRDDGTDLDTVFRVEEDEQDDLLPLVGAAASAQPMIERPSSRELQSENRGGESERAGSRSDTLAPSDRQDEPYR